MRRYTLSTAFEFKLAPTELNTIYDTLGVKVRFDVKMKVGLCTKDDGKDLKLNRVLSRAVRNSIAADSMYLWRKIKYILCAGIRDALSRQS